MRKGIRGLLDKCVKNDSPVWLVLFLVWWFVFLMIMLLGR